MSRSLDPYWLIFAQEVPADLGLSLTEEQIDSLCKALEGAYENYGLGSGRDVADANWRAAHDREIEEKANKRVLGFFADRMAILDQGPNFFDYMNARQRFAMHEMFSAEKFLASERQL